MFGPQKSSARGVRSNAILQVNKLLKRNACVNILYWNVKNRDLDDRLCEAVIHYNADIVVLIENDEIVKRKRKPQNNRTLAKLQTVNNQFRFPHTDSTRLQLFTTRKDLNEVYQTPRISIRKLKIGRAVLNFGILHFFDKYTHDDARQIIHSAFLVQGVARHEKSSKNKKTVLVGDFNLNPFDPAMNLTETFNAVASVDCARRPPAKLKGEKYDYFYNPMWNKFGDWTGPPGTYHHSDRSSGHYGWNMLDQVLVRPQAIDFLENIEIINHTGVSTLATSVGRPKKQNLSDHFPLLLELKDKI